MGGLVRFPTLARGALDLWHTEGMGGRVDSQVKVPLPYLQGNRHTGKQELCVPQLQWPLCSLMRTGRWPGLCCSRSAPSTPRRTPSHLPEAG